MSESGTKTNVRNLVCGELPDGVLSIRMSDKPCVRTFQRVYRGPRGDVHVITTCQVEVKA